MFNLSGDYLIILCVYYNHYWLLRNCFFPEKGSCSCIMSTPFNSSFFLYHITQNKLNWWYTIVLLFCDLSVTKALSIFIELQLHKMWTIIHINQVLWFKLASSTITNRPGIIENNPARNSPAETFIFMEIKWEQTMGMLWTSLA